jgi:hypothetical protein
MEQQATRSKEQGRSASDLTFENLEIWQDAVELAARVYELFRSCGEVRSQAYVASRVGLLEETMALQLREQARTLSKRIQRFIDARRERFS